MQTPKTAHVFEHFSGAFGGLNERLVVVEGEFLRGTENTLLLLLDSRGFFNWEILSMSDKEKE